MIDIADMRRVGLAQPFQYGAMGLTGDASGMFLRQWQFPLNYTDRDRVSSNDHDRLLSGHGFDHWEACKARHSVPAEWATWMLQKGPTDAVLAFLIDWNKVDLEARWSGFRILGTVNRGLPVYSLQLFANHSGVAVYSSAAAPNVLSENRPFKNRRW